MITYRSKWLITIVVATAGVSIIGGWLFLPIMMLKKVYDYSFLSWGVLFGVFTLTGYFVFKGLLKLWGITTERPADTPAELNQLAPCLCGDDAKGAVDCQKQISVRSSGKTAVHVTGISGSILAMVWGCYFFPPTLIEHLQKTIHAIASGESVYGYLLFVILSMVFNGTAAAAMVYYPVYAIYLGLCKNDFRKAVLNYLFFIPFLTLLLVGYCTMDPGYRMPLRDNQFYYVFADLLVIFMVLARSLYGNMRRKMRKAAG